MHMIRDALLGTKHFKLSLSIAPVSQVRRWDVRTCTYIKLCKYQILYYMHACLLAAHHSIAACMDSYYPGLIKNTTFNGWL